MKVGRILKNYYSMQMGLLFVIIGIVGGILDMAGFLDSKEKGGATTVAAIIAAIGAVLMVIKYLKVKKYFDSAITARGTVTGSRFYRNWGTISYTYKFEGTEHSGKMLVAKNGETRSMEKGIEINLLLDKHNAGKSLIEDLLK